MNEQAIPKPVQNSECTSLLYKNNAKNSNSIPRLAHTEKVINQLLSNYHL